MKIARDKVPVYVRTGKHMNQGQVWLHLKNAFVELYPQGHICRIESNIGRGVPDVYFCKSSTRRGWLEIKTGKQHSTALQDIWHQNERAAGGLVWVLQVDNGKVSLDSEILRWDWVHTNWEEIAGAI